MKNQNKSCCESNEKAGSKNIKSGIIYGIVPHIGCIAFIVFSVLGVTAATSLFKPLLLNPYFFYILILLSLVFATISTFFYLKRNGAIIYNKTGEMEISTQGVKSRWKYLSTLYGTTILTNLLLFMVIFPIAANLNSGPSIAAATVNQESMRLQVDIPCSGHAPLITDELKRIGVNNVKFNFPNLFDVSYDPSKTSKQQILSLDVFKTYKATVVEYSQANGAQPASSGNVVSGGVCGAGCGGSRGCGCGG